jgi:hypothetical protein
MGTGRPALELVIVSNFEQSVHDVPATVPIAVGVSE